MSIFESIHELPNVEKIKVMEFIWEEVTLKEDSYSSPKWA
jgi:hypothetical protein